MIPRVPDIGPGIGRRQIATAVLAALTIYRGDATMRKRAEAAIGGRIRINC